MKYLVLILVLLGGLGYWYYSNLPPPEQNKMIVGSTEITVEIADDLAEQILGLSAHASLCDKCGMLFVYQRPRLLSFWMKDMDFPLDIIFIREGKITEIFRNVPKPKPGEEITRITATEPADAVLEVNAGFVQKNDISVGFPVKVN